MTDDLRCEFPDNSPRVLDAPIRVRCTVCGRLVTTHVFPIYATCPMKRDNAARDGKPPPRMQPPTFDCVHRGAVVAIGKCDLCGRKGQPFEILACGLHGQCSVQKMHSKVRSCVACEDRQAPTEAG